MSYAPQYPAGGPWSPPQPPTSSTRTSRSPFLLGVVAGLLAALVVAIALYFAGALPTKDDSSSVSTAPISLPTKLGNFVRFQDASLNRRAGASKTVTYFKKADDRTGAAISAAYGGAGAVQQTYTDQTLESTFAFRAVRAASPKPFVAYQDPAYLGLATAPTEVRTYGSVRCVILYSPPTSAGGTPPADSILTQSCQRSSGNLTVILTVAGGGRLSLQPAKCAALVDQVWDTLS